MTAHELARRLLAGPDVMVTRRGYEYGVEEITTVEAPTPIHLDVHSRSYCGPHEYCDHAETGWCTYGPDDEHDPSEHQVPTVLGVHLS